VTYSDAMVLADGLECEAEMWDHRHEDSAAASRRALAHRILERAS
jgi:hypothetical protein